MPAKVFLGSGIISLATAYYTLLQSPSTHIHLIDPSPTPYPGASRKAAGFLAKDWFVPSVAPLGALSFALHRELAELHGGAERWGYADSIGVSLAGIEEGGGRGEGWLLDGTSRATTASSEVREKSAIPPWVVGGGEAEMISGAGTTAQVNPELLCTFLYETLVAQGVEFHLGARAERVVSECGVIVGVDIVSDTGTARHVACDQLLIACGAWSRTVFEHLFPAAETTLSISALAGYSLVVRSPRWQPAAGDAPVACSAAPTIASEAEGGWAPEIFSRRNGDIYIGGLNTCGLPIPAPAANSSVGIGGDELESMLRVSKRLLGEDVEVVKTGLCFRPVTGQGRPVVAGVEAGVAGVWVAAGHGPWGISLSLGTGKVMAEMMAGREAEVDVSGLGIC
ncbi:uncharacterized protein LAJ45_02073 [Morchella importuna]|uniref:uncharacterized protein n=1 Tax=Morchella importuna TaxID=1174673 RepID=UPI001E8E6A4D|nr:uncharacterized protein LAJ45_02073 [Morchella importuna]KAH8154305.1 hypothetical protein LAJ45_02073 [Morchella importuna]